MAGVDSQGITLSYGEDPTYTALGNVISLDGPTPSAETIDVTALDSTGGYREFITSFKDGGELQVGVNFDPEDTGHQAMWTAFNANTSYDWELGFPDGTTKLQFSGALSSPPTVSASVGAAITGTMTIRISGAITPVWS